MHKPATSSDLIPDFTWIPVRIIRVEVRQKNLQVIEDGAVRERSVDHFLAFSETIDPRHWIPRGSAIVTPTAPVEMPFLPTGQIVNGRLGWVNEGGSHLYSACGYTDRLNLTDPGEAAERMKGCSVRAQIRRWRRTAADGRDDVRYTLRGEYFHPYEEKTTPALMKDDNHA